MVEYQERHLDGVFHALADQTRRSMIRDLASRRHTIGELAQPYAMSLAAASKHVQVLERAGLVRRQVNGRTHVCALDAGPLAAAVGWMQRYERFWSSRLDALEGLFDTEKKERDERA